jgi:hypothetical protein
MEKKEKNTKLMSQKPLLLKKKFKSDIPSKDSPF